MNEWINHPLMANMDSVKLELIRRAAEQTKGKSGREMAPIMMALITSAQKKNISFSPEEVSLILELLKDGKTAKEQSEIDNTIQMVQKMKKNFQK